MSRANYCDTTRWQRGWSVTSSVASTIGGTPWLDYLATDNSFHHQSTPARSSSPPPTPPPSPTKGHRQPTAATRVAATPPLTTRVAPRHPSRPAERREGRFLIVAGGRAGTSHPWASLSVTPIVFRVLPSGRISIFDVCCPSAPLVKGVSHHRSARSLAAAVPQPAATRSPGKTPSPPGIYMLPERIRLRVSPATFS